MEQQVLIIHSRPPVIEDVLSALDKGPHKATVSTDLRLIDSLCSRYSPDLLVLEWDPERFGGEEAFGRLHQANPEMQSIFLAEDDIPEIPARYVTEGLRGWQRLPLDIQRLRENMDRCLWLNHPRRAAADLSMEIDERAKNVDTFLAISRAITANLRTELDTLLELIAEETSRMLAAERTSLFIYDRAHDCLWSRVAEGEGGRTIKLGMDQPGIVVHVARTGQALQVQDAYREPLFNPDVDRITGYHTRNILGFPVRNDRSELIGVIETLNKINGPFTDSDERLLAIMSFIFAAAIENAQLYEALRQQIRENESLETQKIQADRMAVVGQMASSIIHDIRSPLAIIRGYAELAIAGSETIEKRQRFANTITAEVTRLHGMARDLQEYSEGTASLSLSRTALGPFIESFVELIEPDFAERGIHIIHHLQYQGDLMLDMNRLKRALHNISANAGEAMTNGGTFMVTSSEVGEHVQIELHDTGSGIPDEIQDCLFDPFVTSGKTHGTGLGLAVVSRIVREHGAEITFATSTTGTTFTIRFPRPGEDSKE